MSICHCILEMYVDLTTGSTKPHRNTEEQYINSLHPSKKAQEPEFSHQLPSSTKTSYMEPRTPEPDLVKV